MALKAKHNDVEFGVGDTIRVTQLIVEGAKKRSQVFEGMVISIRGEKENKSFTVRRIGTQQVGIEKIFPLMASVLEKIEVVRQGTQGVRRAKLYYTRDISKKEVEKIYQRNAKQGITQKTKVKTKKVATVKSKKTKKTK